MVECYPRLLLRLYCALVRSRLEYGGFLFRNLSSVLSSRLDKLQVRCLGCLGYRNSIPFNVILAESREPPLCVRFQFLCRSFLSRSFTFIIRFSDSLLEEVWSDSQSPTSINRVGSFPLLSSFSILVSSAHIRPSSEIRAPLFFLWL